MPTVAKFLIERLTNAGVKAVFGVPGDYVLGFFKRLEDDENIELVGVTDESGGAFAADAYARVNGIGCVCATYNVGSLKCMNPIAGAYAERSPVVLIVGSPGIRERSEDYLLHHTVRDFDTQRSIFANITCANTVLDDPTTAAYEIDRVLAALKTHKQPVYIELPRDIADKPVSYDVEQGTPKVDTSDPINLEEAVDEVTDWLVDADNPVILAGVELSRFGLGQDLVSWAEKTNIPIFTETLSKSTVGEKHPLFGGVYSGSASEQSVRDAVEKSDCILMLGVLLTDMVLGCDKANFAHRQTVRANIGNFKVKNHRYDNVVFHEFCSRLFKTRPQKSRPLFDKKKTLTYTAGEDAKITTKRFFERIDSIVKKNIAVITDVGDSLFGAINLSIVNPNTFISPAYYASMGMAIPAALGVCLARPELRPIVLVGDGAFQMSFGEISTLVQRKLNPIIFVLNNRGYTTERFLLEGKFNDIADWNYHNVGDVFGGGNGYKVTTEIELEQAIDKSLKSSEVSVINVIVGQRDTSVALGRVVQRLSKRLS